MLSRVSAVAQLLCGVVIISCSLTTVQASPVPKKFKRALVVSGGGISPGVSLGIIAGAEQAGWKPDVIIATCGSSMSAAITNSFPNANDRLNFAKSKTFFNAVRQVQLDNKYLLDIKSKFDLARDTFQIIDLFRDNVLKFNESLSGFVPNPQFRVNVHLPRIVILAAKAHFGPANVGEQRRPNLFTQVFFTDGETGRFLQNGSSTIRKIFPQSYISEITQVISNKTTEQAVRASISDPLLINPGKIDNDYYFTGAVDLFPVEVAQLLAEEVLVTYPDGLYNEYENITIESTFGFNQSQRALRAIQHNTVKWIDVDGIEDLRFDPTPSYASLQMQDNIPSDPVNFAIGVQKQFDFGFARVQEALKVQSKQVNVRTHLRRPINPKLLESFTCANANEWRTPRNEFCREDYWPGCGRNEIGCEPLR